MSTPRLWGPALLEPCSLEGSRAQTPLSGAARLTHWLLPDALPGERSSLYGDLLWCVVCSPLGALPLLVTLGDWRLHHPSWDSARVPR